MPPSPLLREVAASLDVPPSLIPHLPALFADLTSLGSMPRTIVRLLRESCLPERNAQVLDLACGKGAVAVAIAQHLHAKVLGLDAYRPFLDAASDLAARRAVGDLCTFRPFNLRDPSTLPRRRFHAALMLGLDPIDRAAPVLRALTRPRGVYIIDDLVRDDRHPRARRYPGVPNRAQVEALIAALGDRVETVHIPPPSAITRLNARLTRALSQRARLIARDNPRLAKPLRDFLARQRSVNTLLTGPLRPAIWVVRRA